MMYAKTMRYLLKGVYIGCRKTHTTGSDVDISVTCKSPAARSLGYQRLCLARRLVCILAETTVYLKDSSHSSIGHFHL